MKTRLALVVVTLLAVLGLALAGTFGGGPGGTGQPQPPLGALLPPPVCAKLPATDHVLGACLPHSLNHRGASQAALSAIQGPDLSNNDPIYSDGSWGAIASRNRFVYLKSVEGTGYYDGTAAAMSAAAGRHALPRGGYDFLHVCGNSASAEASFFVRALQAQGLLGNGTLPPAGDAEYGNGSCGGGSWLQTWVNTVRGLTGRCPIMYTGAWWWQPNNGSYWPTCNGRQILSWISGYGVSWPYMPSGLRSLDFWQFTDAGYNGVTSVDLSAFRLGEAAFRGIVQAAAPPPRIHCFGKNWDRKAALCKVVRPEVARRSQEIDRVRKLLLRYGCRKVTYTGPVGMPVITIKRGPNHDKDFCVRLFAVGTADHNYITKNLY